MDADLLYISAGYPLFCATMVYAMDPVSPRDRQLIQDLLERGSRMLELRLCFHDLQQRSGLSKDWRQHANPACMTVKAEHQPECAAFCGTKIEREIAGLPDGSIHECPFGHTDIAAPVWVEGMLAGVLYAGVVWMRPDLPEYDGFVFHPPRQWLEDRRVMLVALARQLGALLTVDSERPEHSRRAMIVGYLSNRLGDPVRLADVAERLSLSVSRTGHLIKELFGETFPQLLVRLRLARAARLLSMTDLPAGEIAVDTGFADQSHFTRAFRRHYGMSPIRYRKEHETGV